MSKSSLTVKTYDLFDTLIARRCFEPHDVLKNVEQKATVPGFLNARLSAESRVAGRHHSLLDIYTELSKEAGFTEELCEMLQHLELQEELNMLFRIEETCGMVRPGDLIVSDMYLPFAFVRKLIDDVCLLPFCPLYLSSNGKRDRTAWIALSTKFRIETHTGDNAETDIRSPTEMGIPARLYEGTKRTDFEWRLCALGLDRIAEIVRMARLATAHAAPPPNGDRNSPRFRGISPSFFSLLST